MSQIIETMGNALTKEKYTMNLSHQEIKFMHDLLNDHPDVFRKIQGTVDAIMADGKVDIFDLPNLIRLCSQIYHEHLVGYAIQHVGVISLIQFTLDALLDSGILPVNGIAKEILKKVIDSSLELLNANVSSIPYKYTNCFGMLNCSKKYTPPLPLVTLPISVGVPPPPPLPLVTLVTLPIVAVPLPVDIVPPPTIAPIVPIVKSSSSSSCGCMGCKCTEKDDSCGSGGCCSKL
jgi:hypothetical protein